MKRLLTSMALTVLAFGAQASEIKTYEGQLDVAAEGVSRARIQLRVEDAKPGALLVPLAPALKPESAVNIDSAPLGTAVKVVTVGERPHLELSFPDSVESSVPVKLSFAVKRALAEPKARASGKKTLPEGSLLLNHAFVNTQPTTIGSYRMEVVLPEATRVHTVREELPKAKRSEVEPRVGLNGKDGRQGALLQVTDLKQGDATSMSLEVIPDARSWTWLIVGLGLAIAYLFGFRHLVARPKE